MTEEKPELVKRGARFSKSDILVVEARNCMQKLNFWASMLVSVTAGNCLEVSAKALLSWRYDMLASFLVVLVVVPLIFVVVVPSLLAYFWIQKIYRRASEHDGPSWHLSSDAM